MRVRVLLALAALSAGVCALPFAAQAGVIVVGGSMAQQCSEAAEAGRATRADLTACTVALQSEMLDAQNTAGTYINRGVLLTALGQEDAALRDFDTAIGMSFHLGEAYVNRGAVMIRMGRYDEGLANTDRALALTLRSPERAWFNRAIAHESLGDVRAAYSDYRRAAELRPGWRDPQLELARFTVR